MSDEAASREAFSSQLAALAWALAIAAVVALARLVMFAGEGADIEPRHLVWSAACVLSGCLSVGLFLLIAIRRAEARLARLTSDANSLPGAATRS